MLASKLEIEIHNVLKEAGLNFEEEYTFPDLHTNGGRELRFDFAILDDNDNLLFLIEAQGKQHYQPVPKFGGEYGFKKQKYNDSRKRTYCLKNNIKLIYIPYWDEGKISIDYILSLLRG